MYEMNLLKSSPYWGYLQSLPYSSDIPLLWSKSDQDLLRGTDSYRILEQDLEKLKNQHKYLVSNLFKRFPGIFNLQSESSQINFDETSYIEAPISTDSKISSLEKIQRKTKHQIDWFSFQEFIRITSLITSRAFEVDPYLGVCLVPFADLFNHKSAIEDVHVVSDTDVCLLCGKIDGCEHSDIDIPLKGSHYQKIQEAINESSYEEKKQIEFLENTSSDSEESYSSGLDFENNDIEEMDSSSDQDGNEESESENLTGEEMPVLIDIKYSNQLNSQKSDKNKNSISDLDLTQPLNENPYNEEDEEDEEDFIEMVTIRPIPKSKEIFNTYGMHNNAYFLNRYGFYDPYNDQYDTSFVCIETISQAIDKSLYTKKILEPEDGYCLNSRLKMLSPLFTEISNLQPELEECEFDIFCEQIKLANKFFSNSILLKGNVKMALDSENEAQIRNYKKRKIGYEHSESSDIKQSAIYQNLEIETQGIPSDLNKPIDSINNNFGVDFYFSSNGYPNISLLVFISVLIQENHSIKPSKDASISLENKSKDFFFLLIHF
ncbi:Ribosomal lysine N-methyltransferase 3 [Smittium mucronatum]|uniref:Ribosomal lysine N-methyltransferase 3 n=1 Tax=Smittium mucronatum TaxID=133383 RepID=A0A1R0GQE7_9FUNG|nr:Ribosomal lysine N-methyltransferase 3 [Smittium mucronatum]